MILYQILISFLLLTSPFVILFRILKNKEDKNRFIEKFSLFTKKRKKGKLIWFHGASVGEILSVLPLIKKYEKDRLINQILITSSTVSSANLIKKFKFKKTIHQYYPIDHFFFTYRFLNFWKPNIAIFIDSEIWPLMFKSLDEKKIPLLLLNARITKKTFKRWMKVKQISSFVFSKITEAFPQNLETKSYLKKLKVKKISNIGNLKFAENYNENLENLDQKIYSEIIKKNIWVASSTHENEEILSANAHDTLKKKYSNLLTIIIPRHINRTKEISKKLKKMNLNVVLHSSKPRSLKNIDIYLVDTFGETKKFHKVAATVFLGGSIVKKGGQNPLEAARLNAKILHGPNVDNFKDVYKLLRSFNISKMIKSHNQLSSSIVFKKNKILGNKIKNIGEKILKNIIKEIDKYIINDFKKT